MKSYNVLDMQMPMMLMYEGCQSRVTEEGGGAGSEEGRAGEAAAEARGETDISYIRELTLNILAAADQGQGRG